MLILKIFRYIFYIRDKILEKYRQIIIIFNIEICKFVINYYEIFSFEFYVLKMERRKYNLYMYLRLLIIIDCFINYEKYHDI